MGFKEQVEQTVSFIGGKKKRNGAKKRMGKVVLSLLGSGIFLFTVSTVSVPQQR